MLCPDCGVETTGLVEGSCARCFVQRNQIAEVPPHVDILVCGSCHARRVGAHWVDTGRPEEEIRDKAVAESVRAHVQLQDVHVELASRALDTKNHHYDVMVDGRIGDLPVDTLVATTLRVQTGVCTSCSRQAGGYFSAIIQVRGHDRDPTDDERMEAGRLILSTIDRIRDKGNPEAFLSKQGKVKGGHDFYISEIDVARQASRRVADRFDADVSESPSLVGHREGRDVWRVTFLVRLPPYRTGDFVDFGKGIMQVQRLNPKTVVLRDLKDGRQRTVPRDQVGKTHVVARRSEAREVMVVSVVRDEALVLDPKTNQTHEILLPDDLEYDLSIRAFQVVEHDGQMYFVSVPQKSGLPVL